VLAAGCGQSELAKKATYPARGRVLYKGEPARFVLIHFEPTAPGKGVAADGVTDGNGEFELRTYSNADPDGAVPGEYTVTLEQFDPVRSVGITVPKGSTPTKLAKVAVESDSPVEVRAEDNDLQIQVTEDKPGQTPGGDR
jgi:hypothetical protein